MSSPPKIGPQDIQAAHQLYCQMTGQKLTLRYDRERAWYDLLKAGFDLNDVRRLITYLQREIRESRRNVGALKLSNLLQPDRFEEDLALSRIRLYTPSQQTQAPPSRPKLTPEQIETNRRQAQRHLQRFKEQHGLPSTAQSENNPPASTPTNDNNSTK